MKKAILNLGDVILYKFPTMKEAHPAIVIIINNKDTCYYLLNTTSNLSGYPIVNDYLIKGKYDCFDSHNIFLFCENGFNRNSLVLLKQVFQSKDFDSDIEKAEILFTLQANMFNCLINCLDRSDDVKGYYKKLFKHI